MKKVFLLLIGICLISFMIRADELTNDEAAKSVIIIKEETHDQSFPDALPTVSLNTRESFKKVKKNDIVALLIGNNDYRGELGLEPLSQSVNDTTLMSRVLRVCCNVPDDTIHIRNNITAGDFTRAITSVIKTLRDNQCLLLYYSGHGDTDGSLIFTDGSRITPHELKEIVNSCANDTVIILDACYSGNNEGVMEPVNDQKFKNNSIRIYSSLAPMESKEINYTRDYFTPIKRFHENVLGLKGDDALKGNGYFTSFIGYFFAEYDFNNTDNVSYWDLVSYISNKSKHYIEYLSIEGSKSGGYSVEIGRRINQLPKIVPMISNNKYLDLNNRNILIKKYIRPVGLVPEFMMGPFLSFGILSGPNDGLFNNKVAVTRSIRLSYNPYFLKGFLFGLQAGYLYTYRTTQDALTKHDTYLHMIPLMGIIGYRRQFSGLKNRLSIRVDAGIGVSFNIWQLEDFKKGDELKEGYVDGGISFCFQAGTGISVHPVKNLALSLDIQVYGVLFTADDLLLGMKFPFSVSYKL